jgi:hypothetical protein
MNATADGNAAFANAISIIFVKMVSMLAPAGKL